MRRIGVALALIAAIAASYGLGRRQSRSPSAVQAAGRVLYYVDPMHPAYKSDKPGIAPDCGMPLEPVLARDAGGAPLPSAPDPLPPGTVSIDGSTRRLMGIRLASVERSGATRTVRVVGRVAPEDTLVYRINSGVDGFVRETYLDSVGLAVKKGQKLATYYAPDFVAAASGFLAATERVPGSVGRDGARFTPNFPGTVAKEGVRSIQGYTDRLRNLGMSDLQIKEVADSRQLPESIQVVSPADGFILARNISPGQHFDHDMEFYRIADLSRVWVAAEVYERDAPYLRPGGAAQIVLKDQGRRLPARITDSLPQSEAGGGSVKVRLEVGNPGFLLRPEMLVDVELPVRVPPAVTVPLDAVVDSGETARVYVERGEGEFEPRKVETGWRSGERVEILRGVEPGERVVAAATFLVDSESRLKMPAPASGRVGQAVSPVSPVAKPPAPPVAAAKTARDPNCGMNVDPAAAAASGNALVYRGATYYFCSSRCKQAFRGSRAAAGGDPAGRRQAGEDD
jgi:membrane fusion protein, copper/silver efflux system